MAAPAASTIGGCRGGGTSASDIGGAGGAASTDTTSVAPSSTDTTISNPTTRSSRTGLGALPLIYSCATGAGAVNTAGAPASLRRCYREQKAWNLRCRGSWDLTPATGHDADTGGLSKLFLAAANRGRGSVISVRYPYGACTVSVRYFRVHPPYIRRTSAVRPYDIRTISVRYPSVIKSCGMTAARHPHNWTYGISTGGMQGGCAPAHTALEPTRPRPSAVPRRTSPVRPYGVRTASVRYPYGIRGSAPYIPPYARTVSVRCPYGICTVSVRHLQVHPPYIRRTSETSGCTDHPPLPSTHPQSHLCASSAAAAASSARLAKTLATVRPAVASRAPSLTSASRVSDFT